MLKVLTMSTDHRTMAAVERQSRRAQPETHTVQSLIASDRMKGVPVYRSNGKKIGRIERVMIDQMSGTIRYGIVCDFVGLSDECHPVPWNLLRYNKEFEGYEITVSDERLQAAPKYSSEETLDWSNGDRARVIDDYYGATFF